MTLSSGTAASRLMISSVRPSPKNSFAVPPLMSTKGSTTTERSGPADAEELARRPSERRPDPSTAAATTTAAATAPPAIHRDQRDERGQRDRVRRRDSADEATPPETSATSPRASRSRSSSCADWYRASGDFASSRATTASSAGGTSRLSD